MYVHVARLTLNLEKVSKEIDRGIDAKECFAQMNKDGYVKHSIWGQMIHSQSIIMQQIPKELGSE